MIELPIEPANVPAPSHLVDWTERYALIAATCAMRAKHPAHAAMVDEARLDALHRIEQGISESLQRAGTHPQAAAYLSFQFVDRCVAIASSALRA